MRYRFLIKPHNLFVFTAEESATLLNLRERENTNLTWVSLRGLQPRQYLQVWPGVFVCRVLRSDCPTEPIQVGEDRCFIDAAIDEFSLDDTHVKARDYEPSQK